jgi:hypothetical protein
MLKMKRMLSVFCSFFTLNILISDLTEADICVTLTCLCTFCPNTRNSVMNLTNKVSEEEPFPSSYICLSMLLPCNFLRTVVSSPIAGENLSFSPIGGTLYQLNIKTWLTSFREVNVFYSRVIVL